MRWILDSSEAVGQQHLDVPVATEVAVALHLMNVLNTLVAEVSDGDIRIVCAEICQNRDWARFLIVDDRFSNDLATWSDAAFVAGFGGVLESPAYFGRHLLLERVRSEFFGAESSAFWVVLQSIFGPNRAAGVA